MERLKNIWRKIKEKFTALGKMKIRARRRLYATAIAVLLSYACTHFLMPEGPKAPPVVDAPLIPYSEFLDKTKAGELKEVKVGSGEMVATLKSGTRVKTRVDSKFANPVEELRRHQVTVIFTDEVLDPAQSGNANFVPLFIVLIVIVWGYFFFWGIGPRGEIYLKFWQSRAARHRRDGANRITFEDVAGVDEAKAELQEIVEFLKNPKKFRRGRIPKGILLVGPPGTGKTLLARAVAGEAGVPFHYMSGSEFVEMFVGVGASRVRKLFDDAKASVPCIVYIDEVDGIAGRRTEVLTGGDRESHQTTNQLFTELDGFEQNPEIIFLASTNRPEILDEAFLRPGRIDRQVVVPRPDARGREAILKVHIRRQRLTLASDVDLTAIALGTPGFAGADLASIVNEAALMAEKQNPSATNVSMRHFMRAKDKEMMGAERKSLVVTAEDKLRTAYHEVGHAVVIIRTPGTDPVEKVSIVPRGSALGVTIQLPAGDRHHYTKSFLTSRIAIMMGGRAAEDIFFAGDISAGAESDIVEATILASGMVCQWGMSDLGPMALRKQAGGKFLGRHGLGPYDCSSELAFRADEEIKKINMEALSQARGIIEKERDLVKLVAEELVVRTELSGAEMQQLMDGKTLPLLEEPVPANGQ